MLLVHKTPSLCQVAARTRLLLWGCVSAGTTPSPDGHMESEKLQAWIDARRISSNHLWFTFKEMDGYGTLWKMVQLSVSLLCSWSTAIAFFAWWWFVSLFSRCCKNGCWRTTDFVCPFTKHYSPESTTRQRSVWASEDAMVKGLSQLHDKKPWQGCQPICVFTTFPYCLAQCNDN